MFASAGSSVNEGDDTSGVCLQLNGGTASALGCELIVTLTTITGKASTFSVTTQYIIILLYMCGVLWVFSIIIEGLRTRVS